MSSGVISNFVGKSKKYYKNVIIYLFLNLTGGFVFDYLDEPG